MLISSSDGRTLIRWEGRFGGLAGALFGGVLGGGGVGIGVGAGAAIGAAGSAALGIGVPILIGGGAYALARTIFVRIVRRREAAARRLIEQIGSYVEILQRAGHAPPDLSPGGPEPSRPG